ncbi:MAG: DUF2764 domain-containing protein, partial [Kiritimatiellaeota bacterium]|nr:DUF2764 domain-containing protein [Kiritimatiellota bacterium]
KGLRGQGVKGGEGADSEAHSLTPESLLPLTPEPLNPLTPHASRNATHAFVRAWRDKDTILRNAVAKARSRSAGTDAAQWLRPAQGDDAQIERLVEDAFQQPDPLRRERALDRARWALVEELQGFDPMHVNVALAYAVKLALALRWAKLDAGRGREVFDQLTRVPDQFQNIEKLVERQKEMI